MLPITFSLWISIDETGYQGSITEGGFYPKNNKPGLTFHSFVFGNVN